jgi:aspartate/glutamate racemase
MSQAELLEKLEARKGTVTPFRWRIVNQCEHIFDRDVIEIRELGSTMITNAGDKRWGVEFEPSELYQALSRVGRAAVFSGISIPRPSERGRRYGQGRIGIVTGNAPESGMLLWQRINRVARRELERRGVNAGDVGLPSVLVSSIPAMGISMELDLRKAQTRDVVINAMKSLCLAGCEILSLACNTTQCFAEDIVDACRRWDVTFISMPEALMAALSRNKCDRARFLGLSFVADFNGLSAYGRLQPTVELFPFDGQEEAMTEIAYKVKQGKTRAAMQQLSRILGKDDPPKIRDKHGKLPVVMALTELSIAVEPLQQKHAQKVAENADTPPLQIKERAVYDTLGVYAEAIVDRWFNLE